MRLKYQLFLSLLLSSGLLIVLLYAFNSWSFNRGFLGYLNQSEIQKLAPMIDELSAGFERSGSWNWLIDELPTWESLLQKYAGKRPSPPRGPEHPPESAINPRPPLMDDDRPPPPRPATLDSSETVLTIAAQLVLADAQRHILIGPSHMSSSQPEHIWLPIRVNGKIEGYLGYLQRQQLSGGLDKVFSEQQRRSFAYGALFVILLSALLAVILAARLVGPILKIKGAVSRISQGEFTHRIYSDRKDEIGDLSHDINRLAMTLDQNLSARQQWLAEISHELRTPVAILQGELEAMIDGVIPVNETSIASLHSESLRLSRLINDLHSLTLSDIGALDYQFEPLDLVSIIAARCHSATPLANSKDISVEIDQPGKPLFTRGDRQRLEQLFDNLLQNSIRYTDPGGTVNIGIQIQTEHIHITWEDASPGVTDDQLPLLFNTLYRVEASRNRATGGAGLGLAIAKRIVEAHDGEVNASHSELGGLKISINLPLFR
ncbi:ATP-binding protein [Granulosicoccus antarcticus]|uniref:histidine kinase n=1 Tax=Granulosicoccus antarcticus IMCC3135 TaxID=1192854 RepID=A0A2Z2NMB6_9GAMM|nr:ATP-binding protein [Granulosicoccus antarcticus]ASJ70928.1 Signal transduction histidine-protein kinase BaeS [Granulosicoccus antarcticus IMCC3135]